MIPPLSHSHIPHPTRQAALCLAPQQAKPLHTIPLYFIKHITSPCATLLRVFLMRVIQPLRRPVAHGCSPSRRDQDKAAGAIDHCATVTLLPCLPRCLSPHPPLSPCISSAPAAAQLPTFSPTWLPRCDADADRRRVFVGVVTLWLFLQEGVRALWKGRRVKIPFGCCLHAETCLKRFCSLPAVLLWTGYTGIQFHVYDACMRGSIQYTSSRSSSSAQSLACGSVAGLAATVFTYPLDIIRTVCAQHEAGAPTAVQQRINHSQSVQCIAFQLFMLCALSCRRSSLQIAARPRRTHHSRTSQSFLTPLTLSEPYSTACLLPSSTTCPAPAPLPPSPRLHAINTPLLQVPLIALQFAANNMFLSLAPPPPPGQRPSHLTALVCGAAAGSSCSALTCDVSAACWVCGGSFSLFASVF